MIIKLDTSLFRLGNSRSESVKQKSAPLTRAQWISADRAVLIILLCVIIAGSIIFS